MSERFKIGVDVKERRVAVREIEALSFRLPTAGCQVDAPITLPQRLIFKLDEELPR